MTKWLAMFCLGCGLSADDAARLDALEAKVAALEDQLAPPPTDGTEAATERLQARRQERMERLRALREETSDGPSADEVEGSPDDGTARRQEALDRLRERQAARAERRGQDGAATPPETLRDALENPEDLSRAGRALLHRGPDGNYDGYRLSGIRRGSIPDHIGLKNGDIIQAVAGLPLTSMEETMEAYHALKDAERFEVVVVRRGAPMTLDIGLDDPLPVVAVDEEADPAPED